jgi:hypothetical protein
VYELTVHTLWNDHRRGFGRCLDWLVQASLGLSLAEADLSPHFQALN